jgi:hypothetical protein
LWSLLQIGEKLPGEPTTFRRKNGILVVEEKLLVRLRALKEGLPMRPYIVKFQHYSEGADGSMQSEDMFLCIHAKDRHDAFEKYLHVTDGEQRQNYLTSITGQDKIEAFWDKATWTFVTIPS